MIKFKDIVFDPINHYYKIGEQPLVSVTALLEKLKPIFDREKISQNIVERDGRSQVDVLQGWEKASQIALDKGTRLHQYVEDVFDGKIDPTLRAINDRIPEMDGFDEVWRRLQSSFGAKLIRKEWTIGDIEFGVAGRIDSMLLFKTTGLVHIFDWKTGQFRTTNHYQNLYSPFDEESDCHLVNYSLQISLYRLIIERNLPELRTGDGYLLHLRSDGTYMLYRAIDYRDKLLNWLKNGIPEEFKCDQAMEKEAKYLINRITELDVKLLSNKTKNILQSNLVSVLDTIKLLDVA